MKKITLILTIILFSGCEDLLVEVPKSFVSKANYYQNEADAEGAIAGAYDGLQTNFYGINNYSMLVANNEFIVQKRKPPMFIAI